MEPLPLSRAHPLHGRNLRHAALVVLDRHGAASLREILDVLWANDFRLTGTMAEASKRLADALRHEVRRGRAQRVARGRYAIKHLAPSTRYRILRRWRLAQPAVRDEHDEPLLDGRSPDDQIGPIPWSRHDRAGDHLWLAPGRDRWTVGQRVRTACRLGHCLTRTPPPPRPRYEPHTQAQHQRRLRSLLAAIPCGPRPNARRRQLMRAAS